MTTGGFELVVLGAGTALPRASGPAGECYGPAGYALVADDSADGRVTLLDCGPGTVRALGPAGIGLERVERVVLSHGHTDHLLDLFALFFARRNPHLGPLPPLEVVVPNGLAERIERAPTALGPWTAPDAATTVHEFEPAVAGARIERDGWRFVALPTGHTPSAVGWRVERAGAVLAYSGDSGEVAAQAVLAGDADLYLVECAATDAAPAPHHLHPAAVARICTAAEPRRVLLTHFYPDVDPGSAAEQVARATGLPVEAARDGWRGRVEA